MHLTYKNLTIREASVEDAGQLARWWNDGAVMAYVGLPKGTGETAEEIAERLKRNNEGSQRLLILEADGAPVGEAHYCSEKEGEAEIGIKICEASLQDGGLGKRFLSMLIASLFEELGYGKIVLSVDEKNTRACHVYERLGFRRARVLKDSWKNQLGEWRSSAEYELKPEGFADFR